MTRPNKSIRILLIDDCVGDAVLIKQVTEGSAVPVEITVVRNGLEALTLLAEPGDKPELIILDLNTPRIDGLAFLARYNGSATPVVVFTSSENPRDREAALELGAQDYVVKPMDLNEFTDTVWTIIWRWTRSKNPSAGTTSSQ